MKKGTVLAILVVLMGITAVGSAEEMNNELHGTFQVDTMTKYMWRGFDRYDDHGAVNTTVNLDLYGTGFGLSVMYSQPLSSGYENLKWIPTTLYYHNNVMEGESSQIDYTVGYAYYNFLDNSRKSIDLQELFASFSLPNICPMGVVPSYTIVRMWPSNSGSTASAIEAGGWIHVFGLGYDGLTLGEQPIHLLADITYNDGTGISPTITTPVEHDWSHMVIGAETTFELCENLSFKPGVYFQRAWESTVNTESDELWAVGSLIYSF
ncbi:MAG: hypothetical protein PHF37_02305 [Phycisphaerae bacterium]|nr:hypothetical protein [Phycisphaerae bacterium]